jgi:hypothetical protein
MKRRLLLKNIALIGAGVTLLPYCKTGSNTAAGKFNVSNTDSQLLQSLCNAIIPETPDFAGAKQLKSHDFLVRMITDCTKPEDQKKFAEGMAAFNSVYKKDYNTGFDKLTKEQLNTLFTKLEADKDENNLATTFYKTVKRYTIQSFTGCKEYMVNIRNWKMVPGGNFKGSVKI